MESELFLRILLIIVVSSCSIINYYLVSVVIPYLKNKRIYDIVVFAVQAAEQEFRKSGQGKIKKKYVLNVLKEKGINIDERMLNVLIESAVKELNIKQK